MPRNLIETTRKIFDNLRRCAKSFELSNSPDFQILTIALENDKEAILDFVENAKCKTFRYSLHSIFTAFYDEKQYIILPQECENIATQLNFLFIDDNKINQAMGILAVAYDTLELNAETTSDTICDQCLYMTKDEESSSYVDVSWMEIRSFFQEYLVYECNEQSFPLVLEEDISRLYACMILDKSNFVQMHRDIFLK